MKDITPHHTADMRFMPLFAALVLCILKVQLATARGMDRLPYTYMAVIDIVWLHSPDVALEKRGGPYSEMRKRLPGNDDDFAGYDGDLVN